MSWSAIDLGPVARDGEADAGRRAADLRIGGLERRDADDLAAEVDEGAAAVAGVDRGAGLDGVGQGVAGGLADLAAEGADDALGHARLEPERIAHGQDEVADRELGGVAEGRRGQARAVTWMTAMSSGV